MFFILVQILIPLALAELTEICPWLAARVVTRAARRWSADPDVQRGYAEEWAAIINERPGKLFKLLTALNFLRGAWAAQAKRTVRDLANAVDRARHRAVHRMVEREFDRLLKQSVRGKEPSWVRFVASAISATVVFAISFTVARNLFQGSASQIIATTVLSVIATAGVAFGDIGRRIARSVWSRRRRKAGRADVEIMGFWWLIDDDTARKYTIDQERHDPEERREAR